MQENSKGIAGQKLCNRPREQLVQMRARGLWEGGLQKKKIVLRDYLSA